LVSAQAEDGDAGAAAEEAADVGEQIVHTLCSGGRPRRTKIQDCRPSAIHAAGRRSIHMLESGR